MANRYFENFPWDDEEERFKGFPVPRNKEEILGVELDSADSSLSLHEQ